MLDLDLSIMPTETNRPQINPRPAMIEQINPDIVRGNQLHRAINPAVDEEIPGQGNRLAAGFACFGSGIIGAHCDQVGLPWFPHRSHIKAEAREGPPVLTDLLAIHPDIGDLPDGGKIKILAASLGCWRRIDHEPVPANPLPVVSISGTHRTVVADPVPAVRDRYRVPLAVIKPGLCGGIALIAVLKAPAISQRHDLARWRRCGFAFC